MGRDKATIEPFEKELGGWVRLSEAVRVLKRNQRTIKRMVNEKVIKTKTFGKTVFYFIKIEEE